MYKCLREGVWRDMWEREIERERDTYTHTHTYYEGFEAYGSGIRILVSPQTLNKLIRGLGFRVFLDAKCFCSAANGPGFPMTP